MIIQYIIFLQCQDSFTDLIDQNGQHTVDFFDLDRQEQAQLLGQWDYSDDDTETYQVPPLDTAWSWEEHHAAPWGTSDQVSEHTVDGQRYILTTNDGLQYAGLYRIK